MISREQKLRPARVRLSDGAWRSAKPCTACGEHHTHRPPRGTQQITRAAHCRAGTPLNDGTTPQPYIIELAPEAKASMRFVSSVLAKAAAVNRSIKVKRE